MAIANSLNLGRWNLYPSIGTITCASSAEFVDNLVIISRIISETLEPTNRLDLRFIYRGVSNSKHRLVPSSLRTEQEHPHSFRLLHAIHNTSQNSKGTFETEEFQRKAELSVLRYFYQNCERAGLKLPVILNKMFRDELLSGYDGPLSMATFGQPYYDSDGKKTNVWPPEDLLPIFSLAQHYGLPTPLLDWTFSPFIAAYFAAKGAERKPIDEESANLTVYATLGNTFEVYGQSDLLVSKDQKLVAQVPPGRLVQPSSSENPNLMMQRGVFTVIQRHDEKTSSKEIDRRDLPDILNSFDKTEKPVLCSLYKSPQFFSLNLPVTEAPKLMCELNRLGFSANRIFDGFQGAADGVRERAEMNSIL